MAAGPSGALPRQSTNWIDGSPGSGGPGLPLQLSAYLGTWTTTPPAAPQAGYTITDGYDGAIQCYIVENNVGTATLNIEGSFDNVNWAPVGYYWIVANGTTNDTLTRIHASISQTRNTYNVLQILDPFPLMRVRPSANTGSISAGFYLIPS